MSFTKKHAIRELKSQDAAQDIDDNFDAIWNALRALRSQLDEEDDEATTSGGAIRFIVGPPGPQGEEGPMGPPGPRGSGSGGSGGGSGVDHVVMSDGATPTPSPVDDGFGNFIYIEYTP